MTVMLIFIIFFLLDKVVCEYSKEGYVSTCYTTIGPSNDSEKPMGVRNQFVCADLCLGSPTCTCEVYMYYKNKQICRCHASYPNETVSHHAYSWPFYMKKMRHNEDGNLVRDDRKCRTDIIKACKKGNVARVRQVLLRGNESINCRTSRNKTPIMIAAFYSEGQVVDHLLTMGADLSATDNHNCTALHYACMTGILPTVKRLVESGSDVEKKQRYGKTAIFQTVRLNKIPVFEYLVRIGCNINAVANNGENILHHACKHNLEMVSYILSRNFSNIGLDDIDRHGQTPVHYAVRRDKLNIVRYLVKMGCNMMVQSSRGYTLLHQASKYASLRMVKYIVSLNVFQLDDKTADGQTALQLSKRYRKDKTIVEYLEKITVD